MVDRWYHITVHNYHKDEMAHDCFTYIKSSKKLSIGESTRVYQSVQLKWEGIPEPHVSIPPNSGRNFDALIIPYKKSSIAYFGSLWSAIDFKPPHNEKHRLEGPGDFELIFVVYASKFPPAESKFFLHLGKKLEDVKFYNLI